MSIEHETKIVIAGSHGVRALGYQETHFEMRFELMTADTNGRRPQIRVEVRKNGMMRSEYFSSLGELLQFVVDEVKA